MLVSDIIEFTDIDLDQLILQLQSYKFELRDLSGLDESIIDIQTYYNRRIARRKELESKSLVHFPKELSKFEKVQCKLDMIKEMVLRVESPTSETIADSMTEFIVDLKQFLYAEKKELTSKFLKDKSAVKPWPGLHPTIAKFVNELYKIILSIYKAYFNPEPIEILPF